MGQLGSSKFKAIQARLAKKGGKYGSSSKNSPNSDESVFTSGTEHNVDHPTMPDVKDKAPLISGDGDTEHFDSMVLSGQDPEPWTHQAETQMFNRSGDKSEHGVLNAHPVEESEGSDEEEEVLTPSVRGEEPFTPSGRKIMDSDTLPAGGKIQRGASDE